MEKQIETSVLQLDQFLLAKSEEKTNQVKNGRSDQPPSKLSRFMVPCSTTAPLWAETRRITRLSSDLRNGTTDDRRSGNTSDLAIIEHPAKIVIMPALPVVGDTIVITDGREEIDATAVRVGSGSSKSVSVTRQATFKPAVDEMGLPVKATFKSGSF
ncbi:hypothetical protein MMC16_006608 [Acarospora aff. strigata]|nr:hypothetical protein [Acarospora aff. strigata]